MGHKTPHCGGREGFGVTERYFTPAEVNRLIPELEGIARQLNSLETEIQQKERGLRVARIEARKRGQAVDDMTFLKDETEIDFLRILVQSKFQRVRDLGGEVKMGFLIDFRGQVDGEDVLLCWKAGETEIRWYHGLHEGMMARKAIPEELLADEGAAPDTEAS
jgi:hypothetical protein